VQEEAAWPRGLGSHSPTHVLLSPLGILQKNKGRTVHTGTLRTSEFSPLTCSLRAQAEKQGTQGCKVIGTWRTQFLWGQSRAIAAKPGVVHGQP
jgi:hypothetical protein